MFVITRGYLIDKQEYDLFDEIITIINEHGQKFSCFSAGSRKIESKNGANLNYLDYLEFEFFHSYNKLSRLKKVHVINKVDELYKDKLSIQLMNQFIYKNKFMNKQIYNLYQEMIFYILNDLNDYLLMLYLINQIFKISKIDLNYESDLYLFINQSDIDLNNWNFQIYNVDNIKKELKNLLILFYKKTNIYLNVINFI